MELTATMPGRSGKPPTGLHLRASYTGPWYVYAMIAVLVILAGLAVAAAIFTIHVG